MKEPRTSGELWSISSLDLKYKAVLEKKKETIAGIRVTQQTEFREDVSGGRNMKL